MFDWMGRFLRAYANKDGRGYPDWAMRYIPIVARLRDRLRAAESILEIGANANGVARFATVRVIAVDDNLESLREARATPGVLPVAADAAHLPFKDRDLDVCLCVDTYEHLSPSAREAASREIMRVLRDTGVAVVAFPAGKGAVLNEQYIREKYRLRTGRTLQWLEEHAVRGLPHDAEIASVIEEAAGAARRVSCSKNATLWVWSWMWRIMMCGWPGRGNALFQALLRAATPILCRMHFGACYRTMIWIEPR